MRKMFLETLECFWVLLTHLLQLLGSSLLQLKAQMHTSLRKGLERRRGTAHSADVSSTMFDSSARRLEAALIW